MIHDPHAALVIAMGKKPPMGDDGAMSDDDDGGDSGAGGQAAAQDFLSAIESKDAGALWQAFQDMAKIADTMPHDEASHDDDEPMAANGGSMECMKCGGGKMATGGRCMSCGGMMKAKGGDMRPKPFPADFAKRMRGGR